MTRRLAGFSAAALLASLAAAHAADAAVTLLYFRGQAQGDTVVLEWETATEYDSAGFHVARASLESGPYVRTGGFVPARGDGLTGARYDLTDGPLSAGMYWYRLEEIDYAGRMGVHGPIAVAVVATATPSPRVTPFPSLGPTEPPPSATPRGADGPGLPTRTPLATVRVAASKPPSSATSSESGARGVATALPTLRSVAAPVSMRAATVDPTPGSEPAAGDGLPAVAGEGPDPERQVPSATDPVGPAETLDAGTLPAPTLAAVAAPPVGSMPPEGVPVVRTIARSGRGGVGAGLAIALGAAVVALVLAWNRAHRA